MSTTLERRVIAPGDLRASGEKIRRIVGHASVFDKWTTLAESPSFVSREIVRPGAYRNAIKEGQDVRSLWNHDANFVLGRTKSGTLRLREDGIGLMTETDPPDTQFARDLMHSIERGDISQMSFAFTVRRSGEVKTTVKSGVMITESGGDRVTVRTEGKRFIEERELLDVNLFDVSPVTYPAYEQTDVQIKAQARERERQLRKQIQLMAMELRLRGFNVGYSN